MNEFPSIVVFALMIACGGGAAITADDETPRDEAEIRSARESGSVGEDRPREVAGRRGEVVLESDSGEVIAEVHVEVAANEFDRQRGLMYRRYLAPDAGMLFVFEEMEPLSFWMENTFIPLDMIFIDDALRVVGIVENAEPLTRDAREVEGLSQYVLEVNAGFCRRYGIEAGQRVRVFNVPGLEETP